MKTIGIVVLSILITWFLLTLWVERSAAPKSWLVGSPQSTNSVLIVYDPDPFYNFDEQVCKAFADGLSEEDFRVKIATIAAANELTDSHSLYVFCANTYNWRPDWAVSSFIENASFLENKPVVAITLGAGSTNASQRTLEKMILSKKAILIDSKSLWLLRPNDESRLDESNVAIAISQVNEWATAISKKFHEQHP